MNFSKFAYNNVTRNFKTYLAYFLSSAFSVFIFFSFAICMFHPTIRNSGMDIGSTAFMALATSEIVIFMFTFLFILYSLGMFLKIRLKEFGTLTILGITKNQINKLILLENIIIGTLSIVTGIVLGIVFSKFFLLLSAKVLYIDIDKFYFPIQAILLTLAAFALLFIIIATFTPMIIGKHKVIDLLDGSKKPTKTPKASPVLSIMSVVIIVLGYIVALEGAGIFGVEGNEIYISMVLIVIGTLLLFSQFSVFAIALLKKNRKFYMKKTNLLWISDLAYKLKENSRMLFIVSIVSTVAFTSVAGLFVFNSMKAKGTEEKFPLPYNYIAEPNDTVRDKNIKEIESKFKEGNFEYHKYTATFLEQKNNEDEKYYIMNASDYNNLAKAINRKTIYIKNDEVVLVPTYPSLPTREALLKIKNIKFNSTNSSYKVKEVGESNILPIGILSQMVVVNDDVFNKISNKLPNLKYYGYDVPRWKDTLNIQEEIRKDMIDLDNPEKMTHYVLNSPSLYYTEKQQGNMLLYMGFFIGVIFFIGAGSFLYFRFYTDLNQDKEKYKNMAKIGLSTDEIKKTSTIQMATLFFVPYIVASIHTIVALKSLENITYTSLIGYALTVLGGFFVAQVIYFLIIRSFYLKNVTKHIGEQ
ncbi:ABC transporter permease protein [Gottschalkia purinilytica]|uniref:ABC transporter permease protein n=1 Tax=Gottschalkia purinilytica TaxID=1503 RepID=A0A0L0W8X2_GOTPU|nr:ABC transporter permease [Gottschalkia purinilytica]KNF07755.1 ABC transporter permease protein [Gottschalkia purinilytica]